MSNKLKALWETLEPGDYFMAAGNDSIEDGGAKFKYVAIINYIDHSTTPPTLNGDDIWDMYGDLDSDFDIPWDNFVNYEFCEQITEETHPEYFL